MVYISDTIAEQHGGEKAVADSLNSLRKRQNRDIAIFANATSVGGKILALG